MITLLRDETAIPTWKSFKRMRNPSTAMVKPGHLRLCAAGRNINIAAFSTSSRFVNSEHFPMQDE